jgi:phage head maturation protease
VNNKIKIKGPNEIRAEVTQDSVNVEDRTIEVVWTTGAKGLRRSWEGDFYEELGTAPENVDMSRLQSGAPFLASHDASSLDNVIGVVESARLDQGKGLATIRFARDEKSQAVFEKVKDGIIRNISVGYRIDKMEDVSKRGDKVPTLKATRWTPMEISAVAINFDKDAQVRNENIINEVEVIESRLEQNNEVIMPPENKPNESVDTKALEIQARQAEKTRQTEIRNAVRAASLEETFADELINADLSFDDASKRVFAKMAEKNKDTKVSNVHVEVGASHEDKVRTGVENTLQHRINPEAKLTEQGRQYRGMSMIRLASLFVGSDSRYMSDEEIIKRAMTTSDFPLILANVAEKELLAKYQLAPATFEPWTRKGTLRNFKTKHLLQTGEFPAMKKRQQNGEFEYGSVGESEETVRLEKYGRILSLTEEIFIDDDLGAVSEFVQDAGPSAKRLESDLVYSVLSDNADMADSVALFHANHANLGTTGAPSETTFNEAFQAMKGQLSIGGQYLNISPAYAICGPQMEASFKKFLSTIQPTATSDVNIYAGSVKLIVDPRISNKNWFLAADPSSAPTVTLFRHQGQEGPRVSTRNKWENGNFEIKVEHAAVAKAPDYRGLFKNPYA